MKKPASKFTLAVSTTGKSNEVHYVAYLTNILFFRRNAYLMKKAAAQSGHAADPYRYYYEQQLQNQM